MLPYKLRRGDLVLVMLLVVIFLLSLIYPVWHWLQSEAPLTAVISQSGVVIESIDLSLVKQTYEFTIWDAAGKAYNVIEVEHGRIRVKAANCAEQIDVKAGWLQDYGDMAVCLPHQLVIELKSTADPAVDSIVR
ncbi:MAG: NusG domain II-containing protein [Negativicutes bacterium]|nr:NusG domain II-containing protein [Negativicutes bacterium]